MTIRILALIIACLVAGVLPAQTAQSDGEGYEKTMQLDHTLYRFARMHERTGGKDFWENAREFIACLDDGRVKFSMVNQRSRDFIDLEYLRSLGLEVMNHAGRRAKCAISPAKLLATAGQLREGYFMQAITIEPQNNQGPAAMNASGYNGAGIGGEGIRIGVIDYDFDGYAASFAAGVAPSYQLYNSTGRDFGTTGTSDHGTACTEIVFDHAPNATYYIMMIDNDSTDWVNAIQWAISNQVDIISCSLGPHNTGWDDDTGYACQAANNAAANNILFFVSAGNEAQRHWIGQYSDSDNDDWHNWSGNDEGNGYVVDPGRTLNVWLQWDSDPSNDFYDLYFFVAGSSFASSQSPNNFEHLTYSHPSSAQNPVTIEIRVREQAANPPQFEIFAHDRSSHVLEYAVATSSLESPANATSSNVISVGAVSQGDYAGLDTANVITDYSSQGPTHGGLTAPDICAPTDCTTLVSMGTFGGTSCAAPNAAGAAAAFWSAHPQLAASGVREILLRKAYLYRDWGALGFDNVYGRGPLYLADYDSDNVFIIDGYANPGGSNTLPYPSIEAADQYAPVGYRAVFMSQTHDAPPPGTVLDKPGILTNFGIPQPAIGKSLNTIIH